MTGYTQIVDEVWVPLALARKDGTCPRIFCVFNNMAAPKLVTKSGDRIDTNNYEDFVVEWAEVWAETWASKNLNPCI